MHLGLVRYVDGANFGLVLMLYDKNIEIVLENILSFDRLVSHPPPSSCMHAC